MRIRMLKTVLGSEDGVVTLPFKAGEVYPLGHTTRSTELAQVFLREGWAELVGEAAAEVAPPPAPPAQVAPQKARKR